MFSAREFMMQHFILLARKMKVFNGLVHMAGLFLCLALVSCDAGLVWEKYPSHPVLPLSMSSMALNTNRLNAQQCKAQLSKWLGASLSSKSVGSTAILHTVHDVDFQNRGNMCSNETASSIARNTSQEFSVKAELYLKERWYGSSNKAHTACKRGEVKVNGKKIFSCFRLKNGDRLEISVQPLPGSNSTDDAMSSSFSQDDSASESGHVNIERLCNFTNSLLNPSNFNPPLRVVYEDDCMAVVMKPAGVHSLAWLGTLKRGRFALDDVLPLLLSPPQPAGAPPFALKQPVQPVQQERRGNMMSEVGSRPDDSEPAVHAASMRAMERGATSSLPRPLPCHRLDARVPGCLVVAKTYQALTSLNKQFQDRTVRKQYRAIVVGNITQNCQRVLQHQQEHEVQWLAYATEIPIQNLNSCSSLDAQNNKGRNRREGDKSSAELIDIPHDVGKSTDANYPIEVTKNDNSIQRQSQYLITFPVGGRSALTVMRVLEVVPCNVYGALSRVALFPRTGRRHQLRQHCAALGCPIMGDDLYHEAGMAPTTQLAQRLQWIDRAAAPSAGAFLARGDGCSTDRGSSVDDSVADADWEGDGDGGKVKHREGVDGGRGNSGGFLRRSSDKTYKSLKSQVASGNSSASASTSTSASTSASTSTSTSSSTSAPASTSASTSVPAVAGVRKSIGLLLMAVEVELQHPAPHLLNASQQGAGRLKPLTNLGWCEPVHGMTSSERSGLGRCEPVHGMTSGERSGLGWCEPVHGMKSGERSGLGRCEPVHGMKLGERSGLGWCEPVHGMKSGERSGLGWCEPVHGMKSGERSGLGRCEPVHGMKLGERSGLGWCEPVHGMKSGERSGLGWCEPVHGMKSGERSGLGWCEPVHGMKSGERRGGGRGGGGVRNDAYGEDEEGVEEVEFDWNSHRLHVRTPELPKFVRLMRKAAQGAAWTQQQQGQQQQGQQQG